MAGTSKVFEVVYSEGSTDEAAAVAQVVSPDDLARTLEASLALGFIRNAGMARSLQAKVDAVGAAMDRGNTKTALNTLGALEAQISAQLEKQIDELYVRSDPDRTLEQLRGIGPTIAAAIEALVGDISRFPSGGQFVSYCGLAPRKNKSGLTDPHWPSF